MDADGENLTQLTRGEMEDHRPRFSPDGERIVFDRSHRGGESRIWIMDADGANARLLLDD